MRVLLTRAAKDAAATRKRLEALGYDVIVAPVIEIAGTFAAWPPGVVDAVLATSGHAFAVPIEGPTPEARRLLPLYLVGERTAEFAQEAGFFGAPVVAKNAASLAVEIGKLPGPLKRIVYLAGRDRKPDIEDTLGTLGHKIDVIEVYEARAVDTPTQEATRAFRFGGVNAILHFSRRSANLLLEMASSHGFDVRGVEHCCLSEDVAAPFHEVELPKIHVAKEPSEKALLALLSDLETTANTGS